LANKDVVVSIPLLLQERIERVILEEGSSKSISEYVTSALGEALAKHEAQATPEPLDKEEATEIKKRLIALGYI
jgi:Arc/MetJ-type ribon-helix-helix transcriptional regulator